MTEYKCPECHKDTAKKSGKMYHCKCGYKEKMLGEAAQRDIAQAITLTGKYAKKGDKKDSKKKK